jgi:hypothetical protein
MGDAKLAMISVEDIGYAVSEIFDKPELIN